MYVEKVDVERVGRFERHRADTPSGMWHYYALTDRTNAVHFAYVTLASDMPTLDGDALIDGRRVQGIDLGYHGKESRPGTQELPCSFIDSDHCHYDSSGWTAIAICQDWADAGGQPEFMWKYLENRFRKYFGGSSE